MTHTAGRLLTSRRGVPSAETKLFPRRGPGIIIRQDGPERPLPIPSGNKEEP